jgi:hypothetical protein
MRIVEQRSLLELTGGDGRPRAAGDLGFARIEHAYSPAALQAVHRRGLHIRAESGARRPRFLALDHLRRAQELIPQVAELVHDEQRLAALSEAAGVVLEPYPIGTSCSGINFYEPGRTPIEFHCDGPAFVELVPLFTDGSQAGGSTLVFGGPAEVGLARLRVGETFAGTELVHIPQRVGTSVLFQGRMLLHSAETLSDGHRVTLVLSMRSKAEPWKDNNTLGRLLMDDEPGDVEQDWRTDLDTRQLPALRSYLLS